MVSRAEAIERPGNAAGCAALEVEGLSYSFGARFALQEVAFTIRAGEFVVLLGPNGAGKTTLFSLVTHLYESRKGDGGTDGGRTDAPRDGRTRA